MKKTILYIIDSLGAIGGAEIMMVSPLEEIHLRYNIIIVTLQPGNVFENRGCVYDKYYCINMNSRINIFSAAKKLKNIISENNVSLVHSFLYWSVVVARLACGKKTPHIFSLATMMTEHIYKHKWYSRYTQIIDKITYKKNQVVISPSSEVITDFDNSVGIKGKHRVLYNFVNDDFYKNEIDYKYSVNRLKLVSVGNIKAVKNYQVLIDAFKLFGNAKVSLDIYGEGELKQSLQDQIRQYNLPVKLMGGHNKIYEVLSLYDAFVMPSFHEGFGISAAEAMAAGLPLILSDIKTLHEISNNNALFFDPVSPRAFKNIIESILNGEVNMKALSDEGKKIAKKRYSKEKYIKELLELYEETLHEKISN